jgi:hypothetical protein
VTHKRTRVAKMAAAYVAHTYDEKANQQGKEFCRHDDTGYSPPQHDSSDRPELRLSVRFNGTPAGISYNPVLVEA